MNRWWLRSSYESSAYATCQPAHNAGRANAKDKAAFATGYPSLGLRLSRRLRRLQRLRNRNFAAITPVFDAERFGIKVVSSPRHADILLFTGAVTRAMRMPALRAYESAPIIKSVFPTARVVSAAVFSTISTASGAAATPLSPLMFGSPAARQHRPPPFTVSPWRSVCCNRRFTRWIIAIPPG